MPRVPEVERADLDIDGQAAYDEIAGTRGKVAGGPFAVLLNSPELARRAAHLGAYVRYEAPMAPRHRHLIALIASSAMDCAYEFSVHANLARGEGVTDETIVSIAHGDDPTGLTGDDAIVARFAHQMTRTHKVDQETFDALRASIGLSGLTDVVGALAYFTFIAFPLDAFDVEVRPGLEAELQQIRAS